MLHFSKTCFFLNFYALILTFSSNLHAIEPETAKRYNFFDSFIKKEIPIVNEKETSTSRSPNPIKDWTFITYMSADNDLAPFARKNLRQQADIGSTEYINIVTQLDTRIAGNKKITKRYFVEQNRLVVKNGDDPHSQKMDSGSPNTLIDCCKWAITNYPAKHYVLNLWNHGTGSIDFGRNRLVNPSTLFMYNPETNLFELDRSIPFGDLLALSPESDQRGICFDDSTGHYLTNQDLDYALKVICRNYLNGQKLDIICFDACLMSMVEIGNIVKNYANFMVGSQEVELGTGYHYGKIFAPFLQSSMSPEEFAKHIVQSYKNLYVYITGDYTQSAINLNYMQSIEDNIDQVSQLLIELIQKTPNTHTLDIIKKSKHKLFCTHFDEPTYKDLGHLWRNLLENLKAFMQGKNQNQYKIEQQLISRLTEGLKIISNAVIANVAGKNLEKATGLSIYLPDRRIHPSYTQTNFYKQNRWKDVLKHVQLLR